MQEHSPNCCYCGGAHRTESIDHAPPIALFSDRHRPKGLEFPACNHCHGMFSAYDDFFTILAEVFREGIRPENRVVPRNRLLSVKQRFPEAFASIAAQSETVTLKDGDTEFEAVRFPIHEDVSFIVNFFTARLATALYFEIANIPLPIGSRIVSFWQPNMQVFEKGLPEPILEMLTAYGTLSQGKFQVPDQFEYGYHLDNETGLAVVQYHFHGSFGSSAFVQVGIQDELLDFDKGDLFAITGEGISPLKRVWPKETRS